MRKGINEHCHLMIGYLASPEGLNGEAVLVDWMREATGAKTFDLLKQRSALHTAAEQLIAEVEDCVYRTQCRIVHAGDASRHLDVGRAPMTIDVRLAPDVVGAAGPIRLADALIGRAMEGVNARFGLGLEEPIRVLANEWQLILEQTD